MEGALVATARFIADKGSILFQLDEKLKAITGIEEKMEKLKELSTIIDMVIEDVDSRPLIDDVAKNMLRKLRYLAYDLEDIIDYYDTTEALRKLRSSASFEQVRDFFSADNQLVFKNTISGMIQAVTESLDSILLQKSFLLNLSQPSIRMSELSLHRAAHSRNSFDVIGREPEKKMIVDMLTDDDEGNHCTVNVISIVGMGGLGKTTLAQLIFNDERVKAHFASLRMWKVVGSEFDPTKILTSVLELATRQAVNISEIDLVMQELENTLSGKRFLLVLDDVWNENVLKWGVVKAALTCGARGSKILMTTRSQQVSSIMDSSYSHQIKQLSRADCLSLFQRFAFGDREVDQSLMEIGGKIVEKCGGVPLAAISLGSMLRSTRDKIYWSAVLNSEIWQLRDDEQKVLAILKLSYDALPLQSKKCFAFGSLFSKDSRMQKGELIDLWIANGFVHSEGNFDAETVGNRVFDNLIMRSFYLLAIQLGDENRATLCTMHDLMHDLARSVSGDVYWNFIEDSMKDIGNRTYHLQFRNTSNNIFQVLEKKPLYLRTLILRNCELYQNANLFEIIFSELKFLRVLDLSNNNIRKLPTSIGNLIHLRYLDLSGSNYIEVLPDSITLLRNLQYLYCDSFSQTLIPCGLSRLINLRCLPVFVAGDRPGACSITELEDLKLHGEMSIIFSENFTNYSRGGRKILKNKELSKLWLKFNGSERNSKDMLDDLCPNTSLENLRICNYVSRQFPAWLMESQLPNLIKVSLENCCDCEHIPPFGNLQILKKLDIEFMNGITRLGAEFHGYGGFPSLQELDLSKMNNLEEWSESHGVDELFPSLRRLRIIDCPKLKYIPRLPTIQHLDIFNCSGNLLSYIGRLTSLSVLNVKMMDDMTSLPSGCLRNLTSLTELEIIECTQLQYLPGNEIQRLKMIRSLTIGRCGNLASFPSEVGCLSSLCSLSLKGCPSITLQPQILVQILNSLPKFQIGICGKNVNLRGQLQHLHTLRGLFITRAHDINIPYSYISGNSDTELGICCCDELDSLMIAETAASSSVPVLEELYIDGIFNLTTFPDWLQHLRSLRFLTIRNFPRLERVPKGLENLHMLKILRIYDCPQLEGRCERETGEDWPIISHVPYVYFL